MDKFFWFILALILFIIEIMTPGVFFFSAIGVGALLTGIFFWIFPEAIIVGWIVFILSSVVTVYFVRPLVRKMVIKQPVKSNVDSLIGQKALVIEKIDPPHLGMVKIAGELWRAEGDVFIDSGQLVEIIQVEGNHLKVKKI